MKTYKSLLILVNLLAVLVLFHYSLAQKEHTLHSGKLVLLKLAPVDPRSLMQGDYMRLNYDYTQIDLTNNTPMKGVCICSVTAQGIATPLRFSAVSVPLQKNEIAIKYHLAHYAMPHLGAESYFFEEGTDQRFVSAMYGALRVDADGNSVLVGLYNEKLQLLQ